MGNLEFDDFFDPVVFEVWEVAVDQKKGVVDKIRLLMPEVEEEREAHRIVRQHVRYHDEQGTYILPVAVFDSEGFQYGAATIPKFRKQATKKDVKKAKEEETRRQLLIDPEAAVYDNDRKDG